MVCDRCITTVHDLLEKLGHDVESVALGEASIGEVPSAEELDAIAKNLKERGFQLIRAQEDVLVEEIKAHLLGYLKKVEAEEDPPKLSDYLKEHMHQNYSYISNRFSNQANSTIEQYLIKLKIERVKELLTYKEMTLSEIAWKLNYSSVQYLSNQFKKVTGETVSSFRQHLNTSERKSLDAV